MADQNGSVAMTSSGPVPIRPAFSSHQSSSVPSTPLPRARRLSSDAQSPSPSRVNGTRSPTARSETYSGSKSLRKENLPPRCKYETSAITGRRRIVYSIGSDPLPRPQNMPKKYLNPQEEEGLTGDMRELYDRLLPSTESDERRAMFAQKVDSILHERWPGNDIEVHVFGSSGNLLSTEDSDVDLCITTGVKELERVCLLAKVLAECGMERVVCVPAKVPIVKVWDPEYRLACDINVNNPLALENTRMIKTYVQIDERVRPLALIIKYWTRQRILNDAAYGGTLSSYTWICMILNFLQTRNPPVLPCLHKRIHQRLKHDSEIVSTFADDIGSLKTFGHRNKETLGELLFHFFRRYGHEIDYEKQVVSVREGSLTSKEEKRWHLTHNNRLCVEEPFNVERNLGNTADDNSFRGVHLELRRAFDLLSEAKLEECMQQYVFPETEERVFEKPPSKPLPVMSRSRSQSQSGRGGRGGYANRGHRYGQHHYQHQYQHRNGPQGRRASSATASQKQSNLPGLVPNMPIDHQLPTQSNNVSIDEDLRNRYQLLQDQKVQLTQIYLAQQQAQLLNGSKQLPSPAMQPTRDDQISSAGIRQPPSTAPLQNPAVFPPFGYRPMPVVSHPAIHTNPSSPSMRPAQPDLRRAPHRTPTMEFGASNNSRSHSQPPRPLHLNLPLQHQHPDLLTEHELHQHEQIRQQQHAYQLMEAQNRARTAVLPQMPFSLEHTMDDNSQYVGYYYDPLTTRGLTQDPYAFRARPYHDLQHRLRATPSSYYHLQDHQRSPSPSPAMTYRDRSLSTRSAASAPLGPALMDRDRLSASGFNPSGPVLADGSDGWQSNRHRRDRSHAVDYVHGDENHLDQQQHNQHISAMDFDNPYHGEMHFGALPAESMRSRYLARPPQEGQPHLGSPSTRSRDSSSASQRPRVNGATPEAVEASIQIATAGSQGLGIAYGDPSPLSQIETSPPLNSSNPTGPVEHTARSKIEPRMLKDDQLQDENKLLSPVREVMTPTPSSAQKSAAATPTKSSLAAMYPVQEIPPFKGKKKKTSSDPKGIGKPFIAPIPPFRGNASAAAQISQTQPYASTEVPSPPPKMNGASSHHLSYAERVARGANAAKLLAGYPTSRQQPNGSGSSLADVSNVKIPPRTANQSYAERVNSGLGLPESRSPQGGSPQPPLSPKVNGPIIINEWQQTISKKYKRNKSRNTSGQLGIPADETLRKGG